MRPSFTLVRRPAASQARRDLQKERFGAYFSRVFAYASSSARDEDVAREVAAGAFAHTFSLGELSEDEFEAALFQAARRLAAARGFRARTTGGLSPRERDVISFVFDAQLDRAQIARVIGVQEEVVMSALMRGLRKLQSAREANGTGSAVPSFS